MSHRAMDWALEQDCPAIAKLILVKLASRANEQGECWPSLTRLAKDLQLGRTTLKRQIKALVASGLLKSQPRLNGSGLGSNLFTMDPEVRADPRSGADPPLGPERTDPRSGADPKPVIETVSINPPPYIPPKPKSSARASRRSATAPLIDSDFEAWWRIYPRHVGKKAALVKYRVARKTVEADPLLAAARLYAEKRLGEDAQFTAHPATWLNQGRWLDDEAQPPPERTLEPLPANWRELINLPTEEEPNDLDQSTTPLSNHDRKTAA